jgi:hypothetical protein
MEGKQLRAGKLWPYWLHTQGGTGAGADPFLTISGAVCTFPLEMAKLIDMYDTDMKRPIYIIDRPNHFNVDRYKRKAPGAPEVMELTGIDSSRQITGKLIPTPDGWSGNVDISYYRTPRMMDVSTPTTSYPDAPPHWHELWVVGTTVTLMRSDDPAYDRYKKREDALLLELLRECRG